MLLFSPILLGFFSRIYSIFNFGVKDKFVDVIIAIFEYQKRLLFLQFLLSFFYDILLSKISKPSFVAKGIFYT
ncbi:MAG: hypothetical protein CMB82_09405 [Flammeovirgaceae bacterium]|nr:hypothetical protein [Flammeovirgaceae bacterium]